MIRRSFRVGEADVAALTGAVLCRDVTLPEARGALTVRRGARIDPTLWARLASHPELRLDVVFPEPGEVEQPEASRWIAEAISGPGVRAEPPHQGQVILRADHAGLLRVRGSAVVNANRVGVVLLVTALDGRVVEAGDTVAVVKAAQLWVPRAAVERAGQVAASGPLLRVSPFVGRRGVLLGGPRVRAANFAAARGSLRRTLRRFGADLVVAEQLPDEPASIAAAYARHAEASADVILVGGSIVLDPGDPFLVALDRLGARLVVRGAPIDPGTMFWVAYLGSTAIFGLASCEMYGRLSVFDLVLPYALAGEPIDQDLLAELGYGGLLDQTFPARQPGRPASADSPADAPQPT